MHRLLSSVSVSALSPELIAANAEAQVAAALKPAPKRPKRHQQRAHAVRGPPQKLHRVEPGSAADRSVTGFRIRHGISRASYYRMKREGFGPRETVYGPRTIVILPKDENEWERKRAEPGATERRLLARLEIKRVALAKKAAAAAVKSERHVSKRRQRP